MHRKLNEFRRKPIITCLNDSDPLSDEERDFWSSGCFRGVASEIDTSFRDNVTIARSGIVPYLRSQKADDERKIHEDIIAGRHLNDEFAGITNCIINEKYYSDERFLVGEALTEELKHGSGYIIISNGFIDGNGLESYEIEYTFGAAGDMVDIDKILLYPVRHDGMTTANRCIVYGDRNGIVEPQFLERKYSATENRIRAVVRSLNNDRHHNIHIDIRHSLQDETEIRTEEKQTKLAPDPQIQIRLMERRYR